MIEAEIKELEKKIENAFHTYAIYEYQGQINDRKGILMRLERELAEYRPEDVERGKKAA